jgi:hypothetical protein
VSWIKEQIIQIINEQGENFKWTSKTIGMWHIKTHVEQGKSARGYIERQSMK